MDNQYKVISPEVLRQRAGARGSKYPFAQMQVGDSFEFPYEKQALISSLTWRFKQSRPSAKSKKFIVKRRDETTGVVIRIE